MHKNSSRFETVVAMHNPTSTSHRRILREVDALDMRVMMVETHPDMRYTRDNLYASVEPGFAILGLGGDGTANQLGNIMLQRETAERGLGNVPFVPLRGGNANDIARSYNGKHSVREILQEGSTSLMRPLEVSIEQPNRSKILRYALGYFSVGAAANAAGALEHIKTQNQYLQYGPQQFKEIITTIRAVAESPEFDVDYKGWQKDSTSDVSFVRGRYIAKHGKLAADAAKAVYEHVSTPSAGYSGTVLNMIRLGMGRLNGQVIHQPTSMHVWSRDGSPLSVQYDGETRTFDGEFAVAAFGSNITVGLSERTFTTLLKR